MVKNRKLASALLVCGIVIALEASATQYVYVTGAIYGNSTSASVAYPQIYITSTNGSIDQGGYVQLYDYNSNKSLSGYVPNKMTVVNNGSAYVNGSGFFMKDWSDHQWVNYTIRVNKGSSGTPDSFGFEIDPTTSQDGSSVSFQSLTPTAGSSFVLISSQE